MLTPVVFAVRLKSTTASSSRLWHTCPMHYRDMVSPYVAASRGHLTHA